MMRCARSVVTPPDLALEQYTIAFGITAKSTNRGDQNDEQGSGHDSQEGT